MHISIANTFGLEELTAFEIPDILPRIQLQVIMILVKKESNKKTFTPRLYRTYSDGL